MSGLDASTMRQALLEAIPAELFQSGLLPLALRHLYMPPAHARALNPDNMLVVGIRGAGKTAWWQALLEPRTFEVVARALRDAQLGGTWTVTPGFGSSTGFEGGPFERFPDKGVLRELLELGHEGREIWLSVVLHQVGGLDPALKTWRERVAWVASHREAASRLLDTHDRTLAELGARHLVLFDAMDRTADRREDRRQLLAGLLSLALDLRVTRAIRVKVFVRPDMLDAAVRGFPDASKVLQDKVELRWAPKDLYGLLWQRLGNTSPKDAWFRAASAGSNPLTEWRQEGEIWRIPMNLQVPERQRDLLHEITGPWMGREARRGIPYTWLPNHLADGHGQVSPRSFLKALRQAAEDSQGRYPNHPWALHYESIKRGVAEASTIRVHEIEEDHPWVRMLLEPLRGLKVPCAREEVFSLWQVVDVRPQIERAAASPRQEDGFYASPAHLEEGPDGLLRDLRDIGILIFEPDGRLNLPDVYRVGYGLLRKGGVKPVRGTED